MIALMKRILSVSGPYQGRIKLAFVFAFLKAMLSKAPIGLSFLALSAFLQGTMTARLCLWLAVGTVGCVLLECLCQNIADRLQAAAGYMVFADLRMELGRHLRRLPMGYFTEGNIGKISSVLSTDMVFIEENCMHDIANMMSYTFAQAILVLWLAFLNPWLGLAALVVVGIIWQLGRASLGSTLAHSGAALPWGAPWLTLMSDRSRARLSHGQCWTMWRALVLPRPSTCWESVPRSSPKISPGAARSALRLRRAMLPGCGPFIWCAVWARC